jgi:hypothetical protein
MGKSPIKSPCSIAFCFFVYRYFMGSQQHDGLLHIMISLNDTVSIPDISSTAATVTWPTGTNRKMSSPCWVPVLHFRVQLKLQLSSHLLTREFSENIATGRATFLV